MGKDPQKPRGKMSSYAYFVQTCREEHKKKHPEASVNFAEFSKKCSERWKVRQKWQLFVSWNAVFFPWEQFLGYILFLNCLNEDNQTLRVNVWSSNTFNL